MSIFDILKRRGKKEFMKYEDGKIIPVKVEEHKNYKEFNISPEEDLDIRTVIKEKVDMPGKVKKYGTFKTLKITGAIAVVIFFGFTVKEVYLAFTDTTPPVVETQPNKNTGDTNTPSENGSFQPGLDDIDGVTLPPDKEEPKKDSEKDNKKDKSPLKSAIDASNVVNSMIVTEMRKEVINFQQHQDNKLNKTSFEKRLKESLETKKQLALYLQERKDIFKDEDMMDFYHATEERLNRSMEMTVFILESFNNSTTQEELAKSVNEAVATEGSLKEEQKKLFLELLNDKEIEYTVDDVKNEISYTIE
jgi:hypothetical protein